MNRTASVFAISCLAAWLAVGAAPLRAEWIEDGVGICTTTGTKAAAQIVSDGGGGAIIAWSEYRTTWNIYAQRIDADGVILWGAGGAAVCDFVGAQRFPAIVSDGAGGAIAAWYDDRNGNNDIYAQKIDANGSIQWTADGVALMTAAGEQYNYGIVSDGAGGAIVAIYDSGGNGDVYAQRIAADGTVLWGAGGLPVCTTTDLEMNPMVAGDGAHGAIVVFLRNIEGTTYTYANRVDAGGTVMWAAEGVPVCTAGGSQYDVKVVGVAGGAMATWGDNRSGSNIYAQLIDSTGAVQWGATGTAVCTAVGAQETPQIAVDGAGGAIITWVDYRNGPDPDIYAQRMSGAGSALWAANGLPVCISENVQNQVQIASDGSGGALLVWRDLRAGPGDYNIYMQRIDADGAPVWLEDGVIACAAASTQQDPQIASDGMFGGIAAWTDLRSGFSAIYAHRENPIVPTLLVGSAARRREGVGVELVWTLSTWDAGMRFSLYREPVAHPGLVALDAGAIERTGLSFSFLDRTARAEEAYRYRVTVSDEGGTKVLFDAEVGTLPPPRLELSQNCPNPFNPSTVIRFTVPERGLVTLDVYDAGGRLVTRLIDGARDGGPGAVTWNGLDGAGRAVRSGVYFCRLTAGKETLSRKMVLLR
jgi:hypothetical protein